MLAILKVQVQCYILLRRSYAFLFWIVAFSVQLARRENSPLWLYLQQLIAVSVWGLIVFLSTGHWIFVILRVNDNFDAVSYGFDLKCPWMCMFTSCADWYFNVFAWHLVGLLGLDARKNHWSGIVIFTPLSISTLGHNEFEGNCPFMPAPRISALWSRF